MQRSCDALRPGRPGSGLTIPGGSGAGPPVRLALAGHHGYDRRVPFPPTGWKQALREACAGDVATLKQIALVAVFLLLTAALVCPPWIVFALEPFRSPQSTETLIVVFGGWGGLLLVVTVRGVLDHPAWLPRPGEDPSERKWSGALRVLEAYLFLTGAFAAIYFQLAHSKPHAFSQPITYHFDAVYFTIATFTTTGFGDIHPAIQEGKILVSVQMVMALILIAVVVAGLVARLLDSSRG
jgi:hypothetical protein